MKKIPFEWEIVEEKEKTQVYKAKVIGGWLVMTVVQEPKLKIISHSTIFLADRDHEWFHIPPYKEERPPESKLAADFGAPEVSKAKS